ncbi:hypothetical protein [Helicobacter cetorum]|uniref:Uncharacterized protein n=2 Tax=Helicobacter cetorum TaxID=138563 RepID=I0EPL7_HELC0|nr:hypothetical protein [Helicobacter cetorum]ABS86820.1 hypothetical protein pz23w [Helicobacter cetorum]AFI04886.1 hypothetical protein HCW_08145 [Helicobacter cetorum MIT 00-7128]
MKESIKEVIFADNGKWAREWWADETYYWTKYIVYDGFVTTSDCILLTPKSIGQDSSIHGMHPVEYALKKKGELNIQKVKKIDCPMSENMREKLIKEGNIVELVLETMTHKNEKTISFVFDVLLGKDSDLSNKHRIETLIGLEKELEKDDFNKRFREELESYKNYTDPKLFVEVYFEKENAFDSISKMLVILQRLMHSMRKIFYHYEKRELGEEYFYNDIDNYKEILQEHQYQEQQNFLIQMEMLSLDEIKG